MTTQTSLDVTHNQPEYGVSELAGAVKRTVEGAFGRVRVRGEISGFKRAASGHLYMDLKDDKAVLNTVCWRGVAGKLSLAPEDGLEVICTGRLSTFPGRSNYQLIVEQMELAGEGALMVLLEKRRKQLAGEGLFDASRKQALPFLPAVVGVVTSPTGAVIRDILHRLQERFPLRVLVWPVAVQGKGAEDQIAAAIDGFNAFDGVTTPPRPDVLIVARGGGSIEDLWAFNEEIAVRAAARSVIPLISAVGHETDTTLIDFAADRRAPTPTAAAEIAVPVMADLRYTLSSHSQRMEQAIWRQMQRLSERLESMSRGLISPEKALEAKMQRADEWAERLEGVMRSRLRQARERHAAITARLRPTLLSGKLAAQQEHLENRASRLVTAWEAAFRQHQHRLEAQSRMLELLSHQSVLRRGFAYVTDTDGQLVTSAATLPASPVTLHFHDASASVIRHDETAGGSQPSGGGQGGRKSAPKASRKPAKPDAPPSSPRQPSLL